jgi:hypothetical protein
MKRKTNQEGTEFNLLKICINYLALEGEGWGEGEGLVRSKNAKNL